MNLGITATGSIGHSSVFMRSPHIPRPPRTSTNTNADNATDVANGAITSENEEDGLDSDDYDATHGGLASRKRMRDSYQIVSQNDVERQGGMRDAFITVRGPSFPIRTSPMEFAVWIRLWAQER